MEEENLIFESEYEALNNIELEEEDVVWLISEDLPYKLYYSETIPLEAPYPPSLWLISEDLPCKSYYPEIIPLEPPYPPSLWLISEDLPYRSYYPEIIPLEPPYPPSLWFISEDLPYRSYYPEIIPLEYPTVLSLFEVDYRIDFNSVKEIKYDIFLNYNTIAIPMFSCSGIVNEFAYTDYNNHLFVNSKNNIIQFWIPKAIELNASVIEIDIGQFTYKEEDRSVRLCLSEEIPEDWDLSLITSIGTGERFTTVTFNVEEIGSRYIGFVLSYSNIEIISIRIDGVEI